jgi:RimJ/RimL family protein N-acetyltransferase
MILKSKTIRMRYVEESDAEFVLSLRLDKRYNQFLSRISPNVQDQREWIRKYKADEAKGEQFYFIIERLDGTPCGTVRIYDLKDDSFCWGSWILNDDKTRYSAVESAFLVYHFGFDVLGFNKSHFDVRKGNDRVVSFHQKMGAVQMSESELDYFFSITRESVVSARNRLKDKLL